jgi:hypothetical protein
MGKAVGSDRLDEPEDQKEAQEADASGNRYQVRWPAAGKTARFPGIADLKKNPGMILGHRTSHGGASR